MQISGYGSSTSLQQMQEMREQMFANADEDGDGGLTLEEFTALGENAPVGGPEGAPDVEEMFSNIDADGDGKVTQSELESAKPPMSPEMSSSLLQAQEDMVNPLEEMFANADSDGDGVLTLEEFEGMGPPPPPPGGAGGAGEAPDAEEVFSQLDTNEDGVVSQEELEAGRPEADSDMSAALETLQETSSSMQDILDELLGSDDSDDSDDDSVFADSSGVSSLISRYLGSYEAVTEAAASQTSMTA